MDTATITERSLDDRIANRLKALRLDRGWSLDALSARCGVSRATLSRLEKAEVSPTASVLGKLCAVYALPMSRLMAMVETDFAPLIARRDQSVWEDPETGFTRRSLSPPAETLAAEVLECALPAGTRLDYASPPRPGLEHHLIVLEGRLDMTIEGLSHSLRKGDCLRYQLFGPSRFETPQGRPAKYLLVMV